MSTATRVKPRGPEDASPDDDAVDADEAPASLVDDAVVAPPADDESDTTLALLASAALDDDAAPEEEACDEAVSDTAPLPAVPEDLSPVLLPCAELPPDVAETDDAEDVDVAALLLVVVRLLLLLVVVKLLLLVVVKLLLVVVALLLVVPTLLVVAAWLLELEAALLLDDDSPVVLELALRGPQAAASNARPTANNGRRHMVVSRILLSSRSSRCR